MEIKSWTRSGSDFPQFVYVKCIDVVFAMFSLISNLLFVECVQSCKKYQGHNSLSFL